MPLRTCVLLVQIKAWQQPPPRVPVLGGDGTYAFCGRSDKLSASRRTLQGVRALAGNLGWPSEGVRTADRPTSTALWKYRGKDPSPSSSLERNWRPPTRTLPFRLLTSPPCRHTNFATLRFFPPFFFAYTRTTFPFWYLFPFPTALPFLG